MPEKMKKTRGVRGEVGGEEGPFRFRLLVGQHIQADMTKRPRRIGVDEFGDPVFKHPSITYVAGDTFQSDIDLAAMHGTDRFQRLGGTKKQHLRDVARGPGGLKGAEPRPELDEGVEEMFDRRRRGTQAADLLDPEKARLRAAAKALEGEEDPGEALREAVAAGDEDHGQGKAETHASARTARREQDLAAAEALGEEGDGEEGEAEGDDGLGDLTLVQLKAKAKEEGIDLQGTRSKDDVLARLRRQDGFLDEDGDDDA